MREDIEDEDAINRMFVFGDQAVPWLIRFLSDPDKDKRVNAARGLSYIGNRHGLEALRNAVTRERDKEAKPEMCYFLAGALVRSRRKQDLALLKKWAETAIVVTDNDGDSLPAVSASLALGIMGDKDSLPVLRKVAKLDTLPSQEIAKAIHWIESGSSSKAPISRPATNDEDAIKTVVLDGTFFGEGERDQTSVEQLTFNSARTKALASLEIYYGPKSARGYDLVLAKGSGGWEVVGIWFGWIA